MMRRTSDLEHFLAFMTKAQEQCDTLSVQLEGEADPIAVAVVRGKLEGQKKALEYAKEQARIWFS